MQLQSSYAQIHPPIPTPSRHGKKSSLAQTFQWRITPPQPVAPAQAIRVGWCGGRYVLWTDSCPVSDDFSIVVRNFVPRQSARRRCHHALHQPVHHAAALCTGLENRRMGKRSQQRCSPSTACHTGTTLGRLGDGVNRLVHRTGQTDTNRRAATGYCIGDRGIPYGARCLADSCDLQVEKTAPATTKGMT